jgi:hypothetical protein
MTAGSERIAVSRKTIGENSMSRKFVACLLFTVFLLTSAEAQQLAKMPRIGYLSGSPASP